MTALVLAPTTDSIQGWLILACLALLAVCVLSAGVAGGDHLAAWLRQRRQFEAELRAQRRAALHYLHVIDVAGTPVRVLCDREVTDYDVMILEEVLAIIEARARELSAS